MQLVEWIMVIAIVPRTVILTKLETVTVTPPATTKTVVKMVVIAIVLRTVI